MKQIVSIFAVLLSLWFITGCTTLEDAKRARGQGISQTYAADFETVWGVIPESLTSLVLMVASSDPQEGCVLKRLDQRLAKAQTTGRIATPAPATVAPVAVPPAASRKLPPVEIERKPHAAC